MSNEPRDRVQESHHAATNEPRRSVRQESPTPNALRATKHGFVVGQFLIAAGKTVKLAVHDGDTISVSPNGFLNTRLLGIDTPKVSFSLPGEDTFPSIGGERWQTFLAGPFPATLPPFSPVLPSTLRSHLDDAVGPGCADNHHTHAKAAEKQLQDLIEADRAAIGGRTISSPSSSPSPMT